MNPFPFLFGSIRHMKLIGEDPEFKALRTRNERRLAALKAANRLYEVKSERTANCSTGSTDPYISAYNHWFGLSNNASNGYQAGSALGRILGIDGWDDR